jgi:hypothetical protein
VRDGAQHGDTEQRRRRRKVGDDPKVGRVGLQRKIKRKPKWDWIGSHGTFVLRKMDGKLGRGKQTQGERREGENG